MEEEKKIEGQDEIITSMYDMLVKNLNNVKDMDDKTKDIQTTNVFDKLYNASKKGDFDEFMKFVEDASEDEISICLETTNNLKIVQYIVEKKGILDGLVECYKNAILYDYVSIAEYIEEKHTSLIQDLIETDTEEGSESYSDIEEEEDS